MRKSIIEVDLRSMSPFQVDQMCLKALDDLAHQLDDLLIRPAVKASEIFRYYEKSSEVIKSTVTRLIEKYYLGEIGSKFLLERQMVVQAMVLELYKQAYPSHVYLEPGSNFARASQGEAVKVIFKLIPRDAYEAKREFVESSIEEFEAMFYGR